MQFTKLNVGSRDELKDGWLNIDIEPLSKPRPNFMQMDVFAMPLVWRDTFEAVQSVHAMEHINRNLRLDFLKAIYQVTAAKGMVYVEVPDFQETIRLLNEAYVKGNKEKQHIWTTSIYGKQRSPGDQHCWGYTVETLSALFFDAGFRFVQAHRSINGIDQMISTHHKQEPCLLVRGIK